MADEITTSKKKWYNTLGKDKIEVIECLDKESERIWIKFEPTDKTKPMEVCNIVDQPAKVSWNYRNSHFETINGKVKNNYYAADMAGSFRVDAGVTTLTKEIGSKIVLFPINLGGSISVYDYSLTGNAFRIESNMPLWVGYVISGSGNITPKAPASVSP